METTLQLCHPLGYCHYMALAKMTSHIKLHGLTESSGDHHPAFIANEGENIRPPRCYFVILMFCFALILIRFYMTHFLTSKENLTFSWSGASNMMY